MLEICESPFFFLWGGERERERGLSRKDLIGSLGLLRKKEYEANEESAFLFCAISLSGPEFVVEPLTVASIM